MSLTRSQVEALRAVEAVVASGHRSTAAALSGRLARGIGSTEASLINLAMLGYLERSDDFIEGSTYSLSDKGRGVLLEDGR